MCFVRLPKALSVMAGRRKGLECVLKLNEAESLSLKGDFNQSIDKMIQLLHNLDSNQSAVSPDACKRNSVTRGLRYAVFHAVSCMQATDLQQQGIDSRKSEGQIQMQRAGMPGRGTASSRRIGEFPTCGDGGCSSAMPETLSVSTLVSQQQMFGFMLYIYKNA